MRYLRDRMPSAWLVCSAGVVLACAAFAGTVGADARWLAALGHLIATRHSIPDGVPFASAASHHWPNAPVLAELVFNWLERALGDRGLMLAQLMAVALALWILVRDALSGGASELGTSRAVLLAAAAVLPALAIARSQLFSLALFPLLCCLLRAETRRPSWRIWLATALLVLWANLHGAVLVGTSVLIVYLILSRARSEPLVALSVTLTGLAALVATPALLHTISYYHGVLTNQAAASGQALWGPLSLTSPLDLVFLACAAVLAVQFARTRPPLWERVAAGGLALGTVLAARNGVWLVMFLVPTAARSFTPRREWSHLVAPLAAVSVTVLVVGLIRGPVLRGAGAPLLARTISLAHGSPVLASGALAEQVALDGGTIVAGDPIDAFPRQTQQTYLDWLAGEPRALTRLDSGVRAVLVQRGTAAQRLMAAATGFSVAGQDGQALLYERRAS